MKKFISKKLCDTKKIVIKYINPIIKTTNNDIIICLNGPIGSGKTFISKNIISSFGFNIEDITSPTYCIMNEYKNHDDVIYHIDMYRLNDVQILNNFDFFYLLNLKNIIIIEWISEKIKNYLMKYSNKYLLEININYNDFDQRIIDMEVIKNK